MDSRSVARGACARWGMGRQSTHAPIGESGNNPGESQPVRRFEQARGITL
ncbi:hypothetical protein ANDA3_0206 [plant metagenome]|uniref:Uncharacterized protein n=1 Tax=plant metagenome TaxID=1297885 RepID=A0A484TFG6_9ZZZZ